MVCSLNLVIGLTGGIGSGKSTAAQMFAELGAEIIDTDAISHQLTAPGGAALPAIQSTFGTGMIGADGSLDRATMRQKVFENPSVRKQLEDILHPLIRQEVATRLNQASNAPYRIVVVPLLFETGAYQPIIQRTLVIDCPETLQISRAKSRSGMTESAVRQIMAAQCSREQRLALADDVICNDSGLEKLREEVLALHKKYIALA